MVRSQSASSGVRHCGTTLDGMPREVDVDLESRSPLIAAVRTAAMSVVIAAILVCAGCASPPAGPEVLTIASADYAAAFDAAVEAARRDGMPAVLRDRRSGVIETQPRVAGSILEPWRGDNASLDQGLENTVAYQRRRARFEFAPAGFVAPDEITTTQPLPGPDVVNAQQAPLDLTAGSGDLELRVWVYIERASVPGQRRSTWTRSKATQTQLVYPEGMKDRKGIAMTWTPAARDPDYERRLLQHVKEIVDQRSQGAQTQPLAMIDEPSDGETE